MTLKDYKNLTDRLSFTIDNKSTRMRDDAISYKKLKKNIIEIGIHCSDFILDLDPDPTQLQSLTSMTGEQLTGNYRSKQLKLGRQNVFSVFIKINKSTNDIEDIYIHRSIIDIKALFTFESFSEMIEIGKIPKSVRLSENADPSQLVDNSRNLVNLMKEMNLIKPIIKENYTIGQLLVSQLGNYFDKILANKLISKYGEELALVKQKYDYMNEYISPFRSPLRKVSCCFIIRQLIAWKQQLSHEKMMYYVFGTTNKNEFNILKKKIFLNEK